MKLIGVKVMGGAAMAAALIAGLAGAVIVSPALAKKDEAPKAPTLKLSPEVQKPAAAAQTALAAKDNTTAETNIAAAEAAAKTNDEKYIAAALRLQLEAAKIQTAGGGAAQEVALAAPLDVLISNPSTPAADLPRFNYLRGTIAYNSKQYPQALSYFQKAKALGYTDDNFALQLVQTQVETGDVAGGIAALDAEIKRMKAAGQPVPEDYYKFGVSKLQGTGDTAATMAMTTEWLQAYNTPENWHTVIFVFGFQGKGATTINKRQRVDLFRLLRATRSLAGQAEYGEYAQSAIDIGLPTEGKAVTDEGKASGAFPAGSPVAADLSSQATRGIAAEGSLAGLATKAGSSADGKLATQTGDAYLGQGDYAKAVTLYRLGLQKGGVDTDEVNTHLGIALAKSGDKAGAAAAFALVKAPPRSEIAQLWTAWLNAAPAA